MLSKLSERVTHSLIVKGQIEEEQRELYEYGFFMLISKVLYFTFSILIGIAFNRVIESAIFYVSYLLIRQYAGGYHAHTEARCVFLSTSSIVFGVAAVRILTSAALGYFLIPIALANVVIAVFSPLDTPEKELDESEKKHFRLLSYIALVVLDLIFAITLYLRVKSVYIPLTVSLTLEALLMIFGKADRLYTMKKQRKNE